MCDDSTIYCSDTSHRVDTTDIETYTINGNRETSYFDRMRVHQRCRSFMEASSTCANRCFRLRGDHRLETKEQALRLILPSTWSTMRSISSCGNPDMMVVAAQ